MRVLLDDPGVALDRGAIESEPPTATGSVIDSETFGLRLDVLELAAEQRRRGQVDLLAVLQRDERVGDRAAVAVDDGQLADERRVEQAASTGSGTVAMTGSWHPLAWRVRLEGHPITCATDV